MKLIQYLLIAIILPSVSLANSYSEIKYAISPLFDQEHPVVQVEMTLTGNFSKEVTLILPNYWAGVSYAEQIRNLQLLQNVKNYKIEQEGTNRKITFPNDSTINNITLRYEIHQKPGNPSNIHEAIIRTDLIHAPGYGLFIAPMDLENSDQVKFTIAWQNLPKQWQTLSSYGIEKSVQFTANVPDLLHAVYLAGKLRRYQIADEKQPVFLSIYGTFDLPDQSIITTSRNIIKVQRSFFSDTDFPYYAISLVEEDNPRSSGGTGLRNNFAAHFPKKAKQSDYCILFSHEHFHNWTGGKIRKSQLEELEYWWSEGFTDYYAIVFALRSDSISLTEFVAACNKLLKNYYLSPVLNVPNSRIKQDFWNNDDVSQLPYYRGFVFAIYLNNLIKQKNKNNSLDNVMLDLFKVAKQKEFSAEHFANISNKYTAEKITAQLANFIVQGKTINLKDVMALLPIETVSVNGREIYQFRSDLSADDQLQLKKFFGVQ